MPRQQRANNYTFTNILYSWTISEQGVTLDTQHVRDESFQAVTLARGHPFMTSS